MTDKMFDSFMHDKMQDHISPVPGDMWERIMKEKDRRDKAFFWRKWYGTALLLLLLAGAGISYFYFTGTGVSINNDDKNANITSTQNLKANNAGVADNSNVVTARQKSADRQIAPTGNNAEITSADLKPDINNDQTISKEEAITENESLVNTSSKKYSGKNIGFIDKPASFKRSAQPLVNGEARENNIETYEAAHHFSIAQLAFRDKSGTTTTLLDLLNKRSALNKVPPTDCPPVNARNTNLYVEAYVSPDYNWKKLSSSNTTFLNSKDSTEKIQASFTAGIRLAKAIGNHIVLKGGLQYSQINEKFQVRVENERKTVTVIVTRNIQTSPGVFVTISDTSSYEQIGYVTKTSINKYKNIDLPLLLSYEWGNENIKFAVTSGAILNLHSSSKGQTIDTSGAAVSYAQGNNIYKTNVGMGIYASGSIIKPVGEKMEIFAEPYIRYNISNMTKDGSGFSQKFNSSGINLGIRLNIGRQQ